MRTFGRMRRRMLGGVSTAASLLAVGVLAPAAGAQVTLPTPCPAPVVAIGVSTVTCVYTGAAQTWTVPAGVTSATFDLLGASGGVNNVAGAGGETRATIPVVAGTTYQVMVGGRGGDEDPGESLVPPPTPFSTGGFNGGGNGGMDGSINGTGGGGASDIRVNGACAATGACALTDRIAVAGGGGGSGIGVYGSGGIGGNGGGTSGVDGGAAGGGGAGGGGATPVAGGAGAPASATGDGQTAPPAEPGSLGQGGHGADFGGGGGGGGGGGFEGGGGGGGAVIFSGGSGGGGGGSALVPSGGTTTAGVRANDDGLVTITYTAPSASYPSLVLAQNPGGYWRFDEASGTTAFDQSPNHNNGTYLNGVTLGVAGAIAGDTAASFDGVNDSVRVPDSNSLDVGDSFTLEGWIKRSSTAQSQELFNKGGNGLQLTVMSAANGNQVWLRKANVTTIAHSTAGVPADGRFHHIVVTKNGTGPTSTVIYIDGVAGTVIAAPAQVIANTAFPLTFSGAGTNQHVLDEFALYDGVLSAADVVAHHNAGAGI